MYPRCGYRVKRSFQVKRIKTKAETVEKEGEGSSGRRARHLARGGTVERPTPRVVFKYFDLTDEFLRIRIVDTEEITKELERQSIANRVGYRNLVLGTCVVDWAELIEPSLKRNYPGDHDAALELLYQICIEVNPRLEIHQVTLPVRDRETKSKKARRGNTGAATERKRWIRRVGALEERLKEQVVGQDPCIERLVRAIRKSAVGLGPKGRPMGCFLFVGHTGVGKTELAKALAQSLFEGEDKLIRIDCSEYGLAHEYAKLIGAPPGYIGHENGGALTDALQRIEEGVVLFDEIEKAHSKVHQLLLQVLDEGRLTDSQGNTISFERTTVLLTSNAGTRELIEATQAVGFSSVGRPLEEWTRQDITSQALRQTFSPEFLNRLDDVLLFARSGTAAPAHGRRCQDPERHRPHERSAHSVAGAPIGRELGGRPLDQPRVRRPPDRTLRGERHRRSSGGETRLRRDQDRRPGRTLDSRRPALDPGETQAPRGTPRIIPRLAALQPAARHR